mmetsp:Transcript_26678/g.48672  ORF Transcript_26678/g.48672 Transcript_26678/m.48672 type:complete len:216 (-) Transcript_26678:202-849(-)
MNGNGKDQMQITNAFVGLGKIVTVASNTSLSSIHPPLHRSVLEFLPLPNSLVMQCVSPGLKNLLEEAFWQDGVSALTLTGFRFNDARLIQLASRFKRLTSVDLSQYKNLTDDAVATLAEHCPGLTSINLSWCHNLTDGAAVALAEHCPSLTSVNLSWCQNLNDGAVVTLAEHCSSITSVKLSWCHNLTYESVTSLMEFCPDLTSIELVGGCLALV